MKTARCRKSESPLPNPYILKESLLISHLPIARRPFKSILIPKPPHRQIALDPLHDQKNSQTRRPHLHPKNTPFRYLRVTPIHWRTGIKSTGTKSNPLNQLLDLLDPQKDTDPAIAGLLLLGLQHTDTQPLRDQRDVHRHLECIECTLCRHHHQAWIQKTTQAMAGAILLHQLGPMVEGYPPAMPRARTPPLREDRSLLPLVPRAR